MRNSGALEGLRVVDFGQYYAGPLAAMILADNGADVIRVDPPGGPRWRHRANAMLQRGKRSIVLDLKAAADLATAKSLVARADVVIENFRPGVMDRLGVGSATMTAVNPRLVYCSIPGFGSSDSRAGVAGWEGVIAAAAGVFATSGNEYQPGSGGQSDRPVFNPLPLASTFAAFISVNSILAALIARQRTGRGQIIETALFEAMFAGFGHFAQRFPPNTQKAVFHSAGDRLFQCADGRWIYLAAVTPTMWRRFSESLMGPEWFEKGLNDGALLVKDRERAQEAVRIMEAMFRSREAAHWDQLVNAAGVPLTVCRTSAEWLHDEQALDCSISIRLDDPELGATLQAGYTGNLSRTPPHVRGPRRALDADEAQIRRELEQSVPAAPVPRTPERLAHALEGIRVLDLSHILAAPTAGQILAQFGADVIKVNSPYMAQFGVLHVNSGKRTALIDLAREEGRAVLWPLIERADVVLENFTQGGMDRLGLGEAAVRARNPSVIYASLSAYGAKGPRRGFRGFDSVGQAITGMALRWGGGRPKLQRFVVNDYGAGQMGAMTMLLALYRRALSGEGQAADTSLSHSGTYHQFPFMIDHEGRVWDEPSGAEPMGWSTLDRIYRSRDGWFYLAAPRKTDHAALEMCAGLTGVSALEGEELRKRLEAMFSTQDTATWVTRLQAVGVGAHRVEDFNTFIDEPWLRSRGLVVVRDHPGVGPVSNVGCIPRLSGTPARQLTPAPLPGANTEEIVRESGFGSRYQELLAKGIVANKLADGVLLWL